MRLRKVTEWITGVSLADLQHVVNDHGNAINQLLGQWGTFAAPTLSGTINNLAPGSALLMRLALSAPATINGMTGGSDGMTRIFVNRTPGTVLTINHENVAAVASDRFQNLGGVNVVVGGQMAMYWYDVLVSRWVQLI